ncbi:hypothetical protein ACFP56_14730 [Paenibacillus septentrionalis]|uniref:Flp pilus-assembly TadG-like N-terminal domain-containing protein n=1 Tax=Paenibacillus septentrionalis TaxID=429342 RepID=A0ABW1V826_9BACL
MYKLLIVPLMLVVWLSLYAGGVDQELAMKSYYKGKQAVNRGAHAAALQLDAAMLAEGVFQLDPAKARESAERIIYLNLKLDEKGRPTNESFIRTPVEIVHFEVLDASLSYPHHYELSSYGFRTTFYRPAVVIVMNLTYPRIFSSNNPVEWNIVGSAQLVPL